MAIITLFVASRGNRRSSELAQAPKPQSGQPMAQPQQQRKLLGKILEEMKVVSQQQVKAALRKQMEDAGKKIGEILVEMGAAKPAEVTEALARQFGYPFVDLKTLKPSPAMKQAIDAVRREDCEQHGFFPIRLNGRAMTVA